MQRYVDKESADAAAVICNHKAEGIEKLKSAAYQCQHCKLYSLASPVSTTALYAICSYCLPTPFRIWFE